MGKEFCVMGSLFGKSFLMALACVGMFFANQQAHSGDAAAASQTSVLAPSHAATIDSDLKGGTYVGRLINLTTYDGEIYVRSLVLSQDDRFITIRFRNAPYSIPWTRVKSVEVVPNR